MQTAHKSHSQLVVGAFARIISLYFDYPADLLSPRSTLNPRFLKMTRIAPGRREGLRKAIHRSMTHRRTFQSMQTAHKSHSQLVVGAFARIISLYFDYPADLSSPRP
ncbi:unnamed protein product [Strongylus vulgaris]|uniref:Uncharacterized protein n=1 Tax=Strongylus vulgaris TaxID=40348 RepID=A0A3P7LL12_STRVU|nr:unnamed protein product [Strongylus vulgaris]